MRFLWSMFRFFLLVVTKIKAPEQYKLITRITPEDFSEIHAIATSGNFPLNGAPFPPYTHFATTTPERLPIWEMLGYRQVESAWVQRNGFIAIERDYIV